MRSVILPPVAVLALLAATLPVAGAAYAQTATPQLAPPRTSAPTTPATEGAPDTLSAEDQNASPFPPGRYAALVKQVCAECHNGKIITDKRYTREDATRFYKNMVSSNIDSDQAQQIIEYLSTTLGQ